MPSTNAERKKKYLEKLKASGGYEAFKQKKAANEKERRDRIKSGLEQLPKAVREKTKRLNRSSKRKKGAEYRQKGKQCKQTAVVASNSMSTSTPPEGYKTASALHKAVAKIKRAVPSTSAKKKQAICKYLKTFEANDLAEIVEFVQGKSSKKKTTRAITSTVIKSVHEFYQRDDISRMSPNMRDCRKFKDPETGLSEVKPIRHLMYKLVDVYSMFVKHFQNGDDTVEPPVKASKFFQLRPAHVKLVGSTPLESCFCMYHTNFIMCCQAIKRYLPEFPEYGKELEKILLCEPPQKNCWWRDCSMCSDKIQKAIDAFFVRSKKKLRNRVEWTQWTKSKETNRFQKLAVPGTLGDSRTYFLGMIPEFLKHSYVKRCQEASFQNDSEEVRQSNGRVALVQIDFPESYTCEAQDEIQSAHWNQANIGLFSSCMKFDREILPQVISSDDTSHTKFEIAIYLYKVLLKLPADTEILKIWSDGPNNQFKNKFICSLIVLFEKIFKVKLIWNFFATSHGKGCVDGIGAVVKNRVRRMVNSRQATVNSSIDFVTAFNKEHSVINVLHMSESDAKKIRSNLKLDEIFNHSRPVPNIFSFHQLQVIGCEVIGHCTSKEGYVCL